jgi:hypothetical protein
MAWFLAIEARSVAADTGDGKGRLSCNGIAPSDSGATGYRSASLFRSPTRASFMQRNRRWLAACKLQRGVPRPLHPARAIERKSKTMTASDLVLALLLALTALLYSSVGHAGASGYLAAMALFDMAPAQMKPTALVLNTLVAAIGTWNFWRGGWLRWRLFWPFALTSIPAALIGGAITLADVYYRPLVGAVLVYSALRLLMSSTQAQTEPRPPSILVAVAAGAVLGLLSGLTGVGGGIFLSPLIVLAGWGTVREASGVAAPFILVNSVAGLIGRGLTTLALPAAIPLWLAAVLVGGALGSWLGSRRLPMLAIRRLLAIVLLLAGGKMLLASI